MHDQNLFVVGATHRSAPVTFREKVALNAEAEAALAVALRRIPTVREFVILNTCNRVEIYAAGGHPGAVRAVAEAFCAQREITRTDLEQFGFVEHGREAVEHLCQVASGLDSQILGETEIFGQAKRAYAAAQTRGTAGAILNRLFQKAFQTAKNVRANTRITTGQVSVANVAVDLALSIFGGVAESRLLVIGAGEMAEKSVKAFRSRGVGHVGIANRRPERAAALAEAFAAEAVPFDQRDEAIATADIAVYSTSSPGIILSREAIGRVTRERRSRPLLVIDLAMPRNVDPAIGRMENVFLYNLDDLALVAARNRDARLAEAEAARRTVAERANALWQQLQLQFVTLPAADAVGAPFVGTLPA